MQAACLGAPRPPCRHICHDYLLGGEGAGGRWVARVDVVNDNVRDAGPESTEDKGRAWRWQGRILWNFRRHPIAGLSARTSIGSSTAGSKFVDRSGEPPLNCPRKGQRRDGMRVPSGPGSLTMLFLFTSRGAMLASAF